MKREKKDMMMFAHKSNQVLRFPLHKRSPILKRSTDMAFRLKRIKRRD